MDKNWSENDVEKGKIHSIYLENLLKEQKLLTEGFPICDILIDEALERYYSSGLLPGEEHYIDFRKEKPIRLAQKIVVPSNCLVSENEFLKSIQKETQCNIKISRRNLKGNKEKGRELFLEISTLANPIECYSRIAYALVEIRKCLTSEQNDALHEDLGEMQMGTEIFDFPENLSYRQFNRGQTLEDPLIDSDFNKPISLDEEQESENKPFDTLDDRLIKLLDGTVLNLNLRYSEVESLEAKSSSKVANSSIHMNASHIPSETVTKTSSESVESEFVATKISAVKRKIIRKNTAITKSKKHKQISIERRKPQNGLKIKKENFPGVFYLKDNKSNKIIKHRILNKSALYRCLKRSKTDFVEPEGSDNNKILTLESLQQNPFELVFEYTPRDIITSFLETMKNYPVLWEFHDKPFNEDYREASEDLCQIINDKWSLKVDNLKMRRSINRVLRFYRYLYPFECIDQFREYFDICGAFLPAAVIRIPHARCSHCFKCFKGDFELKKHLLEEHKSLNWRYKCLYCAESFRTIDEYEFHIHLPHYVEVFTCEYCNKRFRSGFPYSKHIESHEKNEAPKNHMCDECGKYFKTLGELNKHIIYHGKKRYKCHLCPKSYFRKTVLTLHLKTHRKQLDFICEMCGAGFISAPYLKNHIETHMGIQITCKICGLKLRKHNLSRHLKTIHVACEGTLEQTFRAKGHRHNQTTNKKTYIPCAKRSIRSMEKHPRQYVCKICNIQYDRLKFLKDHNQECHSSNVQKVTCKICSSELAQKGNLNRHYKEKHKLADFQIYAIVTKNEDVNTVLENKSQFLEEFFAKVKNEKIELSNKNPGSVQNQQKS